MNVKQLIEKLSTLDQNAMVVIDGYEGGVDEVGNVDSVRVFIGVNEDSWYGAHEVMEHSEDYYRDVYPGATISNAVYLHLVK